MDKITIHDLEVFCRVGVTGEEQAKLQRLLLTVELELDFSQAVSSDDLAATVDYHALTQWLPAFSKGKSWKLIEKLAADVAAAILAEFKPRAVSVEVKKFAIPNAIFVSASVKRVRRQRA